MDIYSPSIIKSKNPNYDDEYFMRILKSFRYRGVKQAFLGLQWKRTSISYFALSNYQATYNLTITQKLSNLWGCAWGELAWHKKSVLLETSTHNND